MRALASIAILSSSAAAEPALDIADAGEHYWCKRGGHLHECVFETWLPKLGKYTVLPRDDFYERVGRLDIPRKVHRRHVLGIAVAVAGAAGTLLGFGEASFGHRPWIGLPVMRGSFLAGEGIGLTMYLDESDGVSAAQARHMIDVAHF